MNALAPRFWTFPAWLTLFLAVSGCAPATPASVPSGPPAAIAVRTAFFLPVLGTWVVDGFSETLREELAKYDVTVVPPHAPPQATAVITLGDWSDLLGTGRALTISLVRQGQVPLVGHVWVPDLSMNTLDVAAEDVAVVIVRLLRAPSDPKSALPIRPQSTALR